MAKIKNFKDILGWREWVKLEDLMVDKVKAKVDTGARTSALHATDIEYFKRGKVRFVRFHVYPDQRSTKKRVTCEAPLVETRKVKSSIGHATERPVIHTKITLGDYEWEIELTLVNRDIMGFRMLIGREAMRGHFLVDPGKSYVQSKVKSKSYKKKKVVTKKNKGKV